MKILIIEDEDYKYCNIVNILNQLGHTEITREKSRNSGICNIILSETEHSQYDVLILDMNMPLYSDSNTIEKDAGLRIALEIKRRNIKLPYIICSSEERINSDAIACIHYDSSVWMNNMFKEALSKVC